jgi:hypothetical protein
VVKLAQFASSDTLPAIFHGPAGGQEYALYGFVHVIVCVGGHVAPAHDIGFVAFAAAVSVTNSPSIIVCCAVWSWEIVMPVAVVYVDRLMNTLLLTT